MQNTLIKTITATLCLSVLVNMVPSYGATDDNHDNPFTVPLPAANTAPITEIKVTDEDDITPADTAAAADDTAVPAVDELALTDIAHMSTTPQQTLQPVQQPNQGGQNDGTQPAGANPTSSQQQYSYFSTTWM